MVVPRYELRTVPAPIDIPFARNLEGHLADLGPTQAVDVEEIAGPLIQPDEHRGELDQHQIRVNPIGHKPAEAHQLPRGRKPGKAEVIGQRLDIASVLRGDARHWVLGKRPVGR